MTAEDVYQVARAVGFPRDTAISMVAIAAKESGFNPYALNATPPDLSYGLWQINMYGNLGPARRAEFGLSSNEELFDPYINGSIAFALWNGNDANLGRHWAIDRGVNQQRYLANLARAQQAAANVDGLQVDPPVGAPIDGQETSAPFPVLVAAVVVAGLLFGSLLSD